MPELATVFRDHIDKYPYVLTPEQRHAVRDICACRTPKIGRWAHYVCPECGGEHFAWASCGNRNCPKCGQDKVVKFLARQQENLLPVNYFMITVTLPHELNVVCRKLPGRSVQRVFPVRYGSDQGTGRRSSLSGRTGRNARDFANLEPE